MIHIDDYDAKKTEEREIFEDLVAERSSADYQHMSGLNLLLIPPGNEPKTAEAIFLSIGRKFGLNCEYVWHGRSAGGNFRLKPQNVSIAHRRISKRLTILYLTTAILMVKLIA